MEEKYGGGLTDILRVNGEAMIITTEEEEESPEEENGVDINNNINYDWQFQNNVLDDFGDPFSNFQDPLLLLHDHDHDHDIQTQDSRLFFNNNNSDIDSSSINLAAAVPVPKIDDDGDQEELIIRRPWPTNNLLARMFQISPPNTKLLPGSTAVNVALQRGLKSPLLAAVNDPVINSCCNSKVDKGGLHLQQISSPPSNAGIKRRKSQVKKVLCVPATAPSSHSRPTTSEVVPSDLWAWRKYGQKPIKGSPYPRSYYRCSSSKGCPAKKQVERSRTDPNMLVITYTCEHNHPWPNSQRNALAAGSTKTAIPSSKNSSNSKSQKAATHCKHDVNQPSVIITGNSSYTSHCVKIKEMEEDFNKPTKMGNDEFSDVFRQSYRPVSPQEDKSEDFFAELGELESDPMNLLFSNGYSEVEARENKSLDPFTFYDWAGSGNNITTSQDEDKMGS